MEQRKTPQPVDVRIFGTNAAIQSPDASKHVIEQLRPARRTWGVIRPHFLDRSTYHASEIGGVVDVTVHCRAFTVCRDSQATFGVGMQGLEDLGPGVGYVLTGDKQQHPSNHWGVPNFLAAVRSVAMQFVEVYPDTPLLYNDISLEYGGVFDVQTRTSTGYDWTPPHDTHRLGKNMDIGVPRGHRQRERAVELFESASVHVFKEDPYHWHLSY